MLVTQGTSFAARLEEHGDRPAVVADGVGLSYDELARRADEVAERLGTTRRLVVLQARNDLGSLLGYLGALRGGHPVLVVDGDNPAHTQRLVDAYDPDVIVTGEGAACAVDARRRGTVHRLHPELAMVLSTSGSTGSPKLVRLSQRNLDANAEAIAAYLELADDDRAITSLPMHYCYGLSVINSHLAARASLVVTDRSVVDRCFWDSFTAAGATNFAGVPYTFELLDRVGFGSMRLPTLRHVTQAGGRLAPERVKRFATLGQRDGWRFFVMYGQTEATARMAYLPPERALTHPDCIGVPVPGGSFDIVPVDGVDADGELVYRGPNVMMGYAHEPADLSLGPTVDVLHTGDLARRTPEGLYRVVGRRSRFVKLFGLRIDLDQVEEALRNVGVEAACVGDDDRILVAFEADGDHELVRATIRDRVGLPASVVVPVAAAVPRLANGKPDYATLSALLREPLAAEGPRRDVAARTPAEVFAAVLGLRVDEVGDDDTFVTLGGDSLTYVEMSVALEDLLGRLPRDWHVTPVGRLATAPPVPRRATSRMEANVVVRAVAIVLVVGSHADLLSWEGGAHALLAVAGFNFARFQLASGRMWRSIARIVVPSVACIGAMAAIGTTYDWRHALLVNGFAWQPLRPAFWYIEALVQVLVALALLFSVPWVRRVERRHRMAFATAVLALGLLVRFDVPGMPFVTHPVMRAHMLVWLFAIGWIAALASSSVQRVALSVIAAVSMVGFFGDGAREALVLAGVLVLVWVRSVHVPRPLNRVVAALAGASLYIYLTHWAVYPRLLDHVPPLVATAGALGAGVAVWTAVRRGTVRFAGR